MSVEALNALKQQFPAAVERPTADHPALTVPIADLTAALRTLRDQWAFDLLMDRFVVPPKSGSLLNGGLDNAHHFLEKRFVAAMESLKIGDPLDESTDIGPLAMPQIVDDLDKQVRDSVAAGAKLLKDRHK